MKKIVATMIETPFALKKFTESFMKAFSKDERMDKSFAINIETSISYKLMDGEFESWLLKVVSAYPSLLTRIQI